MKISQKQTELNSDISILTKSRETTWFCSVFRSSGVSQAVSRCSVIFCSGLRACVSAGPPEDFLTHILKPFHCRSDSMAVVAAWICCYCTRHGYQNNKSVWSQRYVGSILPNQPRSSSRHMVMQPLLTDGVMLADLAAKPATLPLTDCERIGSLCENMAPQSHCCQMV